MGNEIVAVYYYGKKKIYLYGCWDNNTHNVAYDFYDVYDEYGTCLNEGSPFFTMPSRAEILDFLNQKED